MPAPFAAATRLSPFDLTLVALYLVAITIFGLRFSRRGRAAGTGQTLKSYFLADNVIPWWAIALSIVSAETSTLTIVSIPGVAFAGNFGFLQVVLGYMLGRIVVAALFLPRYFQGSMLTAYQLIERRFGPVLHKVTAGLFLLTRAAAEGVRVFAISIVVGIAIGTGDTLSIAIISGLTLLYTFEGGMAAVIWTDVVQMILYVAGTIVALITLGHHVPGGWSHIHALAAPAGKFHMLDFAFNLTSSYTFWAGILGGTFLTMASHGTDQLMVQRMLAARSLRESRLALLSSGAVIFLQFTLFLLIGVGLWVFYGLHPATFRSNDYIFPTFIVREMPHGIAGLLVAAILAAAMSNLSAALNSLSSTTVVDFYMHLRPHAAARERTIISRASTVLWAFVLFAIAIYSVKVGGKGHVVETGLSIASVAYGALLGVFLLGTLTRYATQWGAIIGMICGFAFNLYLWQGTFPQHVAFLTIPRVAFTWYVLLGAIVTFAVGTLASLILPKPRRLATTAALVLLLALPHSASAQPGAESQPDFAPVSTLITTAIAQKKLPGAVVVIGHNGSVVFEQAYGLRKLPGEPGLDAQPSPAEPMTEDTIFDMASLTKVLVTTTAVMQLVEQHKLDLDTPVAHYLPLFAQNGKDRITLRQLLTHYSGLPEDVDLKDSWGLATPDKAEGARRAMASIPYGPPGLTFKYSDINFITLGLLVESVSGEDLDTYARDHIFTPLHETRTQHLPISKICNAAASKKACPIGTWNPNEWIPQTAPTAHDNEGTALTNPDFDHLLRATVHDPTARRMGGVAGHAGLFSNAHDTSLFAQAFLDKLLHNTGPFPLTQATLRLMTTPNEPATAQSGATIFTQDGQPTKGIASHGLGWDINTAYGRPRGQIFPITTAAHPGSFGHTGFTGTSLWIDPTSNTYVILLANAIHPRGNATISPLRGQVATAAAQALGLTSTTIPGAPFIAPLSQAMGGHSQSEPPSSTHQQTLTGIDVLESTHFAPLAEAARRHNGHLRIGLLTNQTGLDAHGTRTIDILAHALPEIQLTTIFAPEHGLFGKQDAEHLQKEEDAATHIPLISVYGPKPSDKHPKKSDLKNLDAIVIDLQDVGVRFWTYETLVGYFLEAAAHADLEVILLDRPNPIAGAVEGPTSDLGFESTYTDFMPIPVRHGLTMGELARYFNAAATELQLKPELLDASATRIGDDPPESKPPVTQPGLHARLTVIPMQHWNHAMFWDQTGLAWVNPSPNLKSAAASVLYPGIGMTEQTNISVGRGTDTPFEHLGAPWINAKELADYLTARHIPGIQITPTTLTIAEDANHYPSHGQTIPGIAFHVTARYQLDSCELGLEVLAGLHKLYPTQFKLALAKNLIANAAVLAALTRGDDPRTINATLQPTLQTFRTLTHPYLLYP